MMGDIITDPAFMHFPGNIYHLILLHDDDHECWCENHQLNGDDYALFGIVFIVLFVVLLSAYWFFTMRKEGF